ncbi:BPSL0761 family protein [Caballeronia sp. J97]|uniref:BPSL0761 family protein n=1 Tax=Caballeronia sp. J97 TaxID=2805429 RepID=UPI002AB31186|nr:BPSL0761 family protein [Caballeronia sp. J97]
MTTPYERALAVKEARELLTEMSTGRLELKASLQRAVAILRNYPGDLDMSIAGLSDLDSGLEMAQLIA